MRCIRLSRTLLACVALTSLAGCPGEDEVLTHGTIKLEMRRSDNQESNPYVGTARVSITMTYEKCLADLYEAKPDLRQTGRDGELVFGTEELGGEGWIDRLCEPGSVSKQADCSVISIEQVLDPVKQLTVEYAITGELEGRVLPFGPLPTKATAGCEDAIVRVAIGGVRGYDGEGVTIWTASAITPTKAVTDQGGEVTVEAARAEN
jgi:hypothetical protein